MKILKHGIKGQYYRFTCPNCEISQTLDGIECDKGGGYQIVRPVKPLEVAINSQNDLERIFCIPT